jgi:hypothetical protein
MKPFIFIFIILICGCSQKKEYDNIEVLTYSWAHGDYKNIKNGFYVHCSTYSKIDNSGNAVTFSDHSYFNGKPFYFISDIKKNLIDSIITFLKSKKTDSIDKKIYDGPCIRIKVNFTNQDPEIYTLPMIIENANFQPIQNLYYSFIKPNKIKLIEKQRKFDIEKDIFIAEAMKYDTLQVLLPPEQ